MRLCLRCSMKSSQRSLFDPRAWLSEPEREADAGTVAQFRFLSVFLPAERSEACGKFRPSSLAPYVIVTKRTFLVRYLFTDDPAEPGSTGYRERVSGPGYDQAMAFRLR